MEFAGERHRALVEQFSHVARTTTIGEMASGLAHELNQPLGAIANYAEGCLVELAAPQPALDEVRLRWSDCWPRRSAPARSSTGYASS